MLDQLIIATDILHTNALLIDRVIVAAQRVAPGLGLAGITWAAHRMTRRVQARRQARAALREADAAAVDECHADDDTARMRALADAIEAAPLIPTRPGARDGTFYQLEALYRAPAVRRKDQHG